MIIPYAVDVPIYRWPIANFAILGTMALAFAAEFAAEPRALEPFILHGFSVAGLVGHMWLHADILHLAGNMLFLWTFGNAVCAKVGDLRYVLSYLGLGLLAGILWVTVGGGAAVGASAAINGVVGLYLVLYPVNAVSCFYFIGFAAGTFSISGFWMILLWFAFDLWGSFAGGAGVAYAAHVAGCLAGFVLGYVLVRACKVEFSETELSLLDVLCRRGRKDGAAETARRDMGLHAGEAAGVDADTRQGVEIADSRRAPAREPSRLSGATGDQPRRAPPAAGGPGGKVGQRAVLHAPAGSFIEIRCPCGTRLRAPATQTGRRFRCQACGRVGEIRRA